MSTNNYLYKALDAYPYDLEETMEALNYALSYNEDNQEQVLCLLGRVQAEKFHNYEKAIVAYQEALSINPTAISVFVHYIEALIWSEDLKEASKFITYALSVKGSDKAILYYKKALIAEMKMLYEEALINLKTANIHTYNDGFLEDIKTAKKRVKQKRKWSLK